MAARDSRRDCRIGSSLSLRERDLGVRVQSLLNPDAEVEDIPTLTPALSRRERVVYAGCFRLMPMAPLRDGEGRRKVRSEKTTDLVKDAVGMVQDQMVRQTKGNFSKTGGGRALGCTWAAQRWRCAFEEAGTGRYAGARLGFWARASMSVRRGRMDPWPRILSLR